MAEGDPPEANQQQDALDYMNFMRYFGGEGDPSSEFLMRGTPEQALLAARMKCSHNETKVINEETVQLYPFEMTTQALRNRIDSTRFLLPLYPTTTIKNKDGSTQEVQRSGVIVDRQERRVWVESMERTYEEMMARAAVVKKFMEQQAYRFDVESYAEHWFKRAGKDVLATHNYRVIFESPPTVENFIPFGQKVGLGIRLIKEIAEGRAKITLDDGTEGYLPNIFAMPPNRGIWRVAVEKFILPYMKSVRQQGPERFEASKREVLEELEDYDDEMATTLAFVMFRHWDLDIKYAFGSENGKSMPQNRVLTKKELGQIKLETGWKDLAKHHLEVRRASEHGSLGSGGHREHIRRAGNPISLRCYPSLMINVLDIMVQDIVPDRDLVIKALAQESHRASGEIDPKTISYTTIKRSAYDLLFGDDRTGTEFEVKITENKGEADEKVWKVKQDMKDYPGLGGNRYGLLDFSQINWDGANVIDVDEDTGIVQFAVGPDTQSFEIPYKLAVYYLFSGIFNQVMREDHLDAYAEATAVGDKNMLLKMNKSIDIGFIMLQRAYQLSDDTMKKLNNYVRAVFLGSLAAAVSREPKAAQEAKLEKGLQVIAGTDTSSYAAGYLLRSAGIHSFLPRGTKDDQAYGFVQRDWAEIVTKIAVDRKAPLPGDCIYNGKPLFTPEELKELEPLYPLGLRA